MWFRKKDPEDVFNLRKKIKINGVLFTIKKIQLLDYLEGAKVLEKIYDTYKVADRKTKLDDFSEMKKAKKYMVDIILAGVVKPKLCRKEEDEGIYIEEVFADWVLANRLVMEIFNHTNGKKK